MTFQALQVAFAEGLGDQTHAGEEVDAMAGGGCDAGALLAAVLEGEEAVESYAGHILARRIDPDHTARFAR